MQEDVPVVRQASPDEADEIAQLLHDFNSEFATPSPGVEVLAPRLRALLAGDVTFAILAGKPAAGFALVTLRPNVFYDGPVALLDEMYVVPKARGRRIGSRIIEALIATAKERGVGLIEINVDENDVDAQRFYERHGFCGTGSAGTDERAFYYWQEIRD